MVLIDTRNEIRYFDAARARTVVTMAARAAARRYRLAKFHAKRVCGALASE
jgi:hypothetical protein